MTKVIMTANKTDISSKKTKEKKGMLDGLNKRIFNFVHKSNIVYNTCWEDPRLDRQILDLKQDDNVLVITSAGCNALDYALDNPNHVYAIDVNPKQNGLLQLKQAAIRNLDYETFFEMFGTGKLTNYKKVYKEKLKPHLSEETQKFWDKKIKFFAGKGRRPSFYFYGTSGTFAALINFYINRIKRIRPQIDELLNSQSVEEQKEVFEKYKLTETLWTPFLKWIMKRDTTLAMLGVPRAQRQQLDRDYEGGILQFVIDSLETVFTKIPLKDNYFWRVYLTGQYTPECCPNYLKPDNFQALKDGLVDKVSTHSNTILGFLEENEVSISRYILLDHMDWLAGVQGEALRQEWQAMVNRSADNTRFLWRSAGLKVEFVDPLKVTANGHEVEMGDMLTYNEELANELHQIDRVHTYGSCFIADMKKPV